MSPEEREFDLQIADLQYELKDMRRQRDQAVEESIRLRHTLEHIYAKCVLAIHEGGPSAVAQHLHEHKDKASY
jgi:hypothetical protein